VVESSGEEDDLEEWILTERENSYHGLLVELSKQTGLAYSTLRYRYEKGDRDGTLIRPPASQAGVVADDDGTPLTVLSRTTGIQYATLRRRHNNGDRGNDLIRRVYHMTDDGNSLTELSRQTGIERRVLQARYDRGDRGDDLIRPISTPKNWKNVQLLTELSQRHDLPISVLKKRFADGDRDDDLVRPMRSQKRNPSRIPGIYWFKNIEKWYVRPRINGQAHYLGCFANLDDAVAARDEFMKKCSDK
jgi:lambda repressor-like predicted transcriptional regulator